MVSSALYRAIETRDILADYVAPIYLSVDQDLNETYDFTERTRGRLSDCVDRLLKDRDNVILVTHSGVIFDLYKLFGVIPLDSPFHPVPLASVHVLHVEVP
jgi:hypothetical protein